MKEIKAFVKPNQSTKKVEALSDAGFKSITISKGEGTGRFKAKAASPSLDFHITDSPVVKLELVCRTKRPKRQ